MSDRRRSAAGGLVYSTDNGRMCPACRRPVADCACRAPKASPAGDGIVRVGRETAGRAGKGVTVVRGLALDPDALDALARRLKAHCGSGGTARDGVVEIQGEHRDKVMAFLQQQGWTVRRSGG